MGISLERAAARYRQGDPNDYSFLLALSVYLLLQKKGQVKIPKKVLQPLLTWMKKHEQLVRPKPEHPCEKCGSEMIQKWRRSGGRRLVYCPKCGLDAAWVFGHEEKVGGEKR